MSERMKKILEDVAAERVRQDEQWGGVDHDDQHCYVTWMDIVRKRADKAEMEANLYNYAYGDQEMEVDAAYRKRLVEIAAVAVAAIEAHDRRCEGE